MTNNNDNLIWADGRTPAADHQRQRSVWTAAAVGAATGLAAPLILWAGIGSRSHEALLLLPVPLILLLRWLHGGATVRPAVAGLVAWLVLVPVGIFSLVGWMVVALVPMIAIGVVLLVSGICAAIAAAGVDLRRVPFAALAGVATATIAYMASFAVHTWLGRPTAMVFMIGCVLGPVLWTAALAAVLAAGRPIPTRTTP